jgi:hypothetical protein
MLETMEVIMPDTQIPQLEPWQWSEEHWRYAKEHAA